MARTNQPDSPLPISAEELPNGVVVLRVHDAIDATNSAALDTYLHTRIPLRTRCVIVDLSHAAAVSPAGVRVLVEHTGRARRLMTVTGTAEIRRTLQLNEDAEMLDTYDSVSAAVAVTKNGVAQLIQEVFDLRAALRSRPLIARALGLVQGRYGVDVDTSFTLLREAAQRFNLKLSALSGALLAVAAPRDTAEWFPGRIRLPAPALSFLAERHRNRTAVLNTFLNTVLEAMDTQTGDLQLVDPLEGSLVMEQHRGLPAEFVDFFATVTDVDTSCGVAMRTRRRVVVTDVANDPIFTSTKSGEMLLDAGIRAVQSTPLVLPDGRCIAVVSTHHAETGHSPTPAQAARLDSLVAETAIWLDWHQRTVVFDALEYLHQRARAHRQGT